MDWKDHNQNLLIIGKVLGVLGLLLLPFAIFSFAFLDAFADSSIWEEFSDFHFWIFDIEIFQKIIWMIPSLYALISFIFIVSAFGLITGKTWGKQFALVPATLLLFEFPIGTAIGVYMIYAIHYQKSNDVV